MNRYFFFIFLVLPFFPAHHAVTTVATTANIAPAMNPLLLPDEDDDELLKALDLDDEHFINDAETSPEITTPKIPTEPFIDKDPQNSAAFQGVTPSFETPISLENTKEDLSYTPLTPEERAQAQKKAEAEKADALALAEKAEVKKQEKMAARENIFNINLSGLKEAGIDTSKDGFAFTGKRHIWNDQFVRLTFALTLGGLLAQGYMNELKIGPLTITGIGPDGKYGTPDDGVIVELKINDQKQRFTASGMIELLGVLARCDLIIGDVFTFFTTLKILNNFETKFLAESRGSGSDIDFVLMGSCTADFIKMIEELALKAVSLLTDFSADGIEALRKEMAKAQAAIDALQNTQKKLRSEFSSAEKAYKQKTAKAESVIAPLRTSVRKLEGVVGDVKTQIWNLRKKFQAGRKATLSGLKDAREKVHSLTKELTSAKDALRKAKGDAKWYKPWMYAVVAAQAIRVAAVEATRWSAEKILQGLMSVINVWPIDATPPLPTLWASYAGSVAALKTAHASLSTALLASNPLAMKEMGEMIGLGIAIATNQTALLSAQAGMITTQAALTAAREASEAAGEVATATIKAATEVTGAVTPILIIGGAIKMSLREITSGKLPTLELQCRVFGKRKNVSMQIDLTKPETFFTAFPKMFIDLVRPGGGGSDISAQIESVRLRYKDQFDEIEKQQKAALDEKTKWETKQTERNAEITKITEENNTREARVTLIDDLRKDDEFGKKLNIDDAIDNPQKPIDDFDEKKPTSYTSAFRYNQYHWTDAWKLMTPNSGTILFNAQANDSIEIGFHNQSTAQDNEKMLDIVIGFEENSSTVIRDKENNLLAQSKDAFACITKGDTFQPYWASYHNGFVSCGKGQKPGEQIILEWQLSEPLSLTHFSFSSHTSKVYYTGITSAPAYTGPFGSRYSLCEKLNTFSWHDAFKLPEKESGTITFRAKADRDIVVGLTQDSKKETAQYLVSYGIENNTMSSLTRVSDDGKNYNRLALCQDNDGLVSGENQSFEPYWVTYDHGLLAAGKGTDPQKNIILESKEVTPAPDITHFSFSCWDNAIEIRDITIQKAIPINFGTRYSAINRNFTYEWRPEWLLGKTNEHPEGTPGSGTITWHAKGAHDMAIGLHTRSDDTTKKTYELIVGAENNQKTLLRDSQNHILTASTDPEARILEMNNYHPYWLSYDAQAHYLTFGSGETPGKNILLDYEGVDAQITHFSFSNEKDFVDFKKISTQPLIPISRGQYFNAQARNNTFIWRPEWRFKTAGSGILLFDAQATNDIVIGLRSTESTHALFEIVIGAEKNSGTIIRDSSRHIIRKDTRNLSKIVNTQDPQPYWVSYDSTQKTLSVGSGKTPGTNSFITTSLEDAPAITHFSLSSLDTTVSYKNIATFNQGDPKLSDYAKSSHESIHRSLDAQHGAYQWSNALPLNEPDSGTILCAIKSDDEARIALHTNNTSDATAKTYEITIGRKKVSILKDQTTVQETTHPDALLKNSGDFFPYWINYYKGQIVIGTGTQSGNNIILEWQDLDAPKNISHICLGSNALPVFYRTISQEKGMRYATGQRYNSSHQRGTFQWIEQWKLPQTDQGTILFKARAEKDICIGLAKDTTSGPTYTVTIGAENNSKTIISKKQPVAETNGAHAFAKGAKPYWITYKNGGISIGTGDTPGSDIIATWQDLSPLEIMHYVSFSSGESEVLFEDITIQNLANSGELVGQDHFVATGRNKTFLYTEAWTLPADQAGTLTFRAQASDNIRIGFQTKEGRNATDAFYEVVLGAQNNSKTLIKHQGAIVAETIAPSALIIHDALPHNYWVSYQMNEITVGTGNDPSKNVILHWRDGKGTADIHYFSLSNATSPIRYANIHMGPYIDVVNDTDYSATATDGSYTTKPVWKFDDRMSGTVITHLEGTSDAMIGLFTSLAQKDPEYQCIFGGENNTSLIILHKGKEVARADYSLPLYQKVPVWVSHYQGTVMCGSGTTPGKQELLRWHKSENAAGINFFGFAAQNAVVSYHSITTQPGVIIQDGDLFVSRATEGIMAFHNTWNIEYGKTITLQAEAPHADIYIGLGANTQDTPLYTIRLGGWRNTKSALLKGSDIVSETPHTMTLGNKQIWITLVKNNQNKTRIIVGTGTPGKKVILDYTDPLPIPLLQKIGLSSGKSVITYSKFSIQSAILPEEETASVETLLQQAETSEKSSAQESKKALIAKTSQLFSNISAITPTTH